jgi:23S rRNA pseudouridine2605 synthase
MSETPEGAAPPNSAREGQRIAKVMARAGLCSRRDAEAWILEGRVSVNGKVLDSPAFNVSAEDDVRVDGQRLTEPERTRLFLFHKPRGLVTTARDPEGRPTIFDALPEDLPRVVAVGRLDINTEGLILLTNDGGLARVLELPATGWLRRYRVRAHGAIDQARLDALREGVTIDGVNYAGIEARLEREQGSNVWMTMGLREGKNREIKRVLEHLGLSVNRLIRVSFGPFELGDLAEGEVAEVRTRVLRDQLGVKLAREAGVNFEAPILDRAAPEPEPPPPVKRGARGDRPPPGRRDRSDREGYAERAPARRSEPEPARLPPKRKHVTALRAEAGAAAEAGTPRRRIERGATSDRRGREVKVERIVAAAPARPKGAEGGPQRRGRRDEAPGRESRPARLRGEGAPFEARRPPRGEGKPFRERGAAGQSGGPSRGGFSGEGRPPRAGGKPSDRRSDSGEGRRPPREEGAPARSARPFRSGPKRDEAPGREARPARSRSEGAPFEARPSRGEARRPPREDSAPARSARPFRSGPKRDEAPGREARPARSRGEDKPFRARASGGEGGGAAKSGFSGEARPPRAGGKPPGRRPPSGQGRPPPRGGGKPGGKRPPKRP